MKRMRFFPFVIGVTLIVTLAPAMAGDVLNRIVERNEIRVGMTGNQPPLNLTSKSGELIGFEVDLVNVLADSMGVKATLVTKPFSQLLPALLAGDVDIVVSGVTITPRRNTKVAFVGPYTVTGKSVLTTSSKLASADDAGDINVDGLKLLALEGSTSQEFVEVLMPKAKLTKTPDYDSAVKLLIDGQADALVADIEACQFAMLRHPDSGLATLNAPLTIEPIGIAIAPDDALLVNLIENYLGTLDGMGLLDELHVKWYESGDWLIQAP
jgi:polar amino acid transport system substrate-binding protein